MPTTGDRDRYEETYREDKDYAFAPEILDTLFNCGGIVVFVIIIIALYILGGR